MSKLTVPQHITNSTIFKVWLESINGIIDEELEIYDILETKSPIHHATEGRQYGIGDAQFYGHLKLTDEPLEELDSNSGIAASPKAIFNSLSDFTARIDSLEEEFYASLQELRVELQEQIDELNEEVSGKAPIYHASADETYGKGNEILYGHLRLNESRSPDYGVDNGFAATPSAVQAVYDDAIAYVDGFNIDDRFETVNRRVDNVVDDVNELEERVDAIENDIESIHDDIYGLGTYFFSEDLNIDAEKIDYGAYVFRNASSNATVQLQNCREHIRIFIANESDKLLTLSPSSAYTINERIELVVLGKGDSVSLVQNPISNTGVVNWTIIGRDTVLKTASQNTSSSVVSINMASEKAQFIEVTGPCSIEFSLGSAESSGRVEYSEKIILFLAKTSNSKIVWPSGIVWMDTEEPPVWGYSNGETLVVKAYQFGERLFLEQKHNSHIVPGLDPELIRTI